MQPVQMAALGLYEGMANVCLGSLYLVVVPLWAASLMAAAALLAAGIVAIRIQDTGNRPLL